MATLVERMVGAAKLDVGTYEEVEADASATRQAMGVVVLSSVAAGIGALRHGGIGAVILAAVISLIAWYLWAFVTYFIGTKLLPVPETRADVGQLLRTTGFSASPGVLRVLGIVPGLGGLVSFAVGLWMLATMVVAVRQALDYPTTGRAIGVCFLGWLVYVLAGVAVYTILAVAR